MIEIPSINYECVVSTFEEIYDIWHDQLWPGRISKIESMSSLYWKSPRTVIKDKTIFKKYTPSFWAIKHGDEIIAVNSGFKTEERIYRSRGLYVYPDYRGQGLSAILLRQAILQGKKEQCHWIWSLPRKTALSAYQRVAFKKRGKWLDKEVEFGPNCLATRQLIYK